MNFFSRMIALLLGVAMLAPLPAQSATQPTAATGLENLKAAIAASTITIKGKQYPAFPGKKSHGPASCQLGDTASFSQGASINIQGGNHVSKNKTYPPGAPEVEIYSPPNSDWVIQSYNRVINSANGTYVAGDTAVPAGYSFTNSVNYSQVSSDMHSYVASLTASGNIYGVSAAMAASLNAQIQTNLSNIESYAYSLQSSNSAVKHNAQVWGMGVLNTQVGHAWYVGWINGTLVCAPAYLHDQTALEAGLKAWVQGVLGRVRVYGPAKVMPGLKAQ